MGSIGLVKEISASIKKLTTIPFYVLLFICSCFLIAVPEYSERFNTIIKLPGNVKDILLRLIAMVYSHYLLIVSSLLIISILISFFLDKLYRYKFLWEDTINYKKDTVNVFNPYTALRRTKDFVQNITTKYFCYSLIFYLLFDQKNFTKQFFNLNSFPRESNLSMGQYLSQDTMIVIYGLFIVNICVTGYSIFNAVFVLEVSMYGTSLTKEDLLRYIPLNTFRSKDEEFTVLKSKYSEKVKFILVMKMLQSTEVKNEAYIIIDISDNLSDIDYHFKAVKENSDTLIRQHL